jgi:hypothetical protein
VGKKDTPTYLGLHNSCSKLNGQVKSEDKILRNILGYITHTVDLMNTVNRGIGYLSNLKSQYTVRGGVR